jgi:hypothetical protein
LFLPISKCRLPIVSHACEASSLREEHVLKVFKNSIQRKIFGLKREEATRLKKTA